MTRIYRKEMMVDFKIKWPGLVVSLNQSINQSIFMYHRESDTLPLDFPADFSPIVAT